MIREERRGEDRKGIKRALRETKGEVDKEQRGSEEVYRTRSLRS